MLPDPRFLLPRPEPLRPPPSDGDSFAWALPQNRRSVGGGHYQDEGHVTTRHWLNHAGLTALLGVSGTGLGHAQQATPSARQNARVEAVWRLEEKYWRLVKAGDVDSYRTLWDDGFRGWPCKAQHPTTKGAIGDWVRDIRDQRVTFRYSLTREGAADFGHIVVVYYQTPMVYEYPDGRVVDRDRVYKFTHTWRKTGDTWLIIGGMCGQLPAPTSP